MTDLADYQREEAVIRRARRVLRTFAGARPDEQQRATRMVTAMLREHVAKMCPACGVMPEGEPHEHVGSTA